MTDSDPFRELGDVSIRPEPLVPRFAVRCLLEGAIADLSVEGEVDVATAGELAVALDALGEQGCTTVRLDLSRVSFLDSTGLAVLAARLRDGRDLRLVQASERVASMLRITGLDRALTPDS